MFQWICSSNFPGKSIYDIFFASTATTMSNSSQIVSGSRNRHIDFLKCSH